MPAAAWIAMRAVEEAAVVAVAVVVIINGYG
jgi:hypothetical protein